MKVAIICAQGVEECEALLTYDLLYRAEIDVHLVGFDKEILSSHEAKFTTNYELKDVDLKEYDCIVLPGGMPGTTNLENSKVIQETIDYFYKNNKLIAVLCAAPSILIHKGMLDSNQFTCFPGFESGKTKLEVKAYQYKNIISGNGLGGTIEFAAKIIENLVNKDKADEILKRIQYY